MGSCCQGEIDRLIENCKSSGSLGRLLSVDDGRNSRLCMVICRWWKRDSGDRSSVTRDEPRKIAEWPASNRVHALPTQYVGDVGLSEGEKQRRHLMTAQTRRVVSQSAVACIDSLLARIHIGREREIAWRLVTAPISQTTLIRVFAIKSGLCVGVATLMGARGISHLVFGVERGHRRPTEIFGRGLRLGKG